MKTENEMLNKTLFVRVYSIAHEFTWSLAEAEHLEIQMEMRARTRKKDLAVWISPVEVFFADSK